MYCPSCGSEERQLSQFCRACGTDLRIVRTSLERPDDITASAITAREQIAQAFADKIRELDSSKDLKRVAEDVLPQFQKFLESPEEKRLRRIRAGVIAATVGLGWTIITWIMAMDKADFLPFIGPGLIAFLIGLGIVLNGLLFTIPKKRLPGDTQDALAQSLLDSTTTQYQPPPQLRATTNELSVDSKSAVPSVTEHTTHHLHSKK
jgi:hypothetical protein